jgi:hypothetical protein
MASSSIGLKLFRNHLIMKHQSTRNSPISIQDGISRREAILRFGSLGLIGAGAVVFSPKARAAADVVHEHSKEDTECTSFCMCRCGALCSHCGQCGACVCPPASPGSDSIAIEKMAASQAVASADNTNSLVVMSQNGDYSGTSSDVKDAPSNGLVSMSKCSVDPNNPTTGWVAGVRSDVE